MEKPHRRTKRRLVSGGDGVTGYSQHGEDSRVWAIAEHWGIVRGRVLEIGAWHPIDKSNSRLFIENGWNAVLVEPAPKPLSDLVSRYNGDDEVLVLGFPITVHGGTIRMHLTDDALSGETIPEQWRESGGFYGSADMNSMSVAAFLSQYGGDFDVVSIDVEGTSVDLFCELLNCGPRPRVVIVEHDRRLVEVNGIAERAHYRQAHVNGTNVIFEWTGGERK